MTSSRGVILVHVMVLMMLMAWLASMFLSAILSRQINARQSISSNEIRAAMNAAAAQITTCLGDQNFPKDNSCGPTAYSVGALDSCVGSNPDIGGRKFKYCITGAVPPCRITVKLCSISEDCSAVACP